MMGRVGRICCVGFVVSRCVVNVSHVGDIFSRC